MLASINPLGERGRNQHYPVTVAAYIAGVDARGRAARRCARHSSARRSRTDGRRSSSSRLIAIAGLAAGRGRVGWRVPGPRRQVDENWLTTYRGWVYGAGFGVQLGLGFLTIVTASATWVVFAVRCCRDQSRAGCSSARTFGLVRAVPDPHGGTQHASLGAARARCAGSNVRPRLTSATRGTVRRPSAAVAAGDSGRA